MKVMRRRHYIPSNSFARTSGSGVTPKGLNLRSPKLVRSAKHFPTWLLTHALVFASAPIHLRMDVSGHTSVEITITDRDSPKESVINAEPIMRRSLIASTRESGW
jgi:hypothetical protein